MFTEQCRVCAKARFADLATLARAATICIPLVFIIIIIIIILICLRLDTGTGTYQLELAASVKGPANARVLPQPGQQARVLHKLPAVQHRAVVEPCLQQLPPQLHVLLLLQRDPQLVRRVHQHLHPLEHILVDDLLVLAHLLRLELDAVDDPHLLQERGLAALARPQQQQLHLPFERLFVLLDQLVDLLALVALLHLLRAELEAQTARARPTQTGHCAISGGFGRLLLGAAT